MLVWFAWKHPRIVLGLVALTAAWYLVQVPGALLALFFTTVVLLLWWALHRRSFRKVIADPWGGRRRKVRYRRAWGAMCAAPRLSWAPPPRIDALRTGAGGGSYWSMFTA